MDLDKDEGLKSRDITKLENAILLCNSLANEYDVIRKEYWNYIAQTIQIQMASLISRIEGFGPPRGGHRKFMVW